MGGATTATAVGAVGGTRVADGVYGGGPAGRAVRALPKDQGTTITSPEVNTRFSVSSAFTPVPAGDDPPTALL